MSRKLLNAATLLSTVLFVSHVQAADGIVRHKIPNWISRFRWRWKSLRA